MAASATRELLGAAGLVLDRSDELWQQTLRLSKALEQRHGGTAAALAAVGPPPPLDAAAVAARIDAGTAACECGAPSVWAGLGAHTVQPRRRRRGASGCTIHSGAAAHRWGDGSGNGSSSGSGSCHGTAAWRAPCSRRRRTPAAASPFLHTAGTRAADSLRESGTQRAQLTQASGHAAGSGVADYPGGLEQAGAPRVVRVPVL